MMTMFCRIVICVMVAIRIVMLPITLCAQQIDKTTSTQDLADQRDAAGAERANKLRVLEQTHRILRDKLGPDVANPSAEAPVIQLRIMACLVKGDYSRLISKIYAKAADTAATAAKEIETEVGASMASPPEAADARRSLQDAIRREQELRSKPVPNGVEKAELEGLPAFENQLRETIALYEHIDKSPATSSEGARQMREKEELLRVKAKQAEASTRFYDAQCAHELSQLRGIDQAERENRLLHQYDRLTEKQDASDGADDKGRNNATPTQGSVGGHPSDAERLSEDERMLADPAELRKRADRLDQLSAQVKSK